jgi:hypothetical protein
MPEPQDIGADPLRNRSYFLLVFTHPSIGTVLFENFNSAGEVSFKLNILHSLSKSVVILSHRDSVLFHFQLFHLTYYPPARSDPIVHQLV